MARPVISKVGEFAGHQGQVLAVAYSGNGQRAISGGSDRTARVWNVASGECIAHLLGHVDRVRAVALSSDGRFALTGGMDNAVCLWEVDGAKRLHTFDGHSATVRGVAFSPDGRLAASGGEDGTVRILDLANKTELFKLSGHSGTVSSVAWSPKDNHVLSGGWDGSVRLWDGKTGQPIRQFRGHTGKVQSVRFSFDGKLAVSGTGGGNVGPQYHDAGGDVSVRVWNVEDGKELHRVAGDWGGVDEAAFHPNGRYVLFSEWLPGRADRFLFMWDTETSKEVARYQDPDSWAPIVGLAISPDGQYALIGREFNADNKVHVLRLPEVPRMSATAGLPSSAAAPRPAVAPFDAAASANNALSFDGNSSVCRDPLCNPNGGFAHSGGVGKIRLISRRQSGRSCTNRRFAADQPLAVSGTHLYARRSQALHHWFSKRRGLVHMVRSAGRPGRVASHGGGME